MTTRADKRGWGDPFAPGFEDHMITVDAGGIKVRVHRDVADVFRYANTILARTYKLAGFADDWGYNRRPIRGDEDEWAKTHDLKWLSNHSWGLAEDLDSSVNPMTRDLAAKHEFVRAIVDPILKAFGGRLVWGGEYSSARKDYMHFEYVGTRKQAVADSAKARKLLDGVHAHDQHPPTPVPPFPEETDMQIVRAAGKPTALLTSTGRLLPLEGGEGEVFIKLGYKITTISPAEFAKLDAVSHRASG